MTQLAVSGGRMTLYKNKYRVESTRLKDFDYSSIANYYVTINLKSPKPFFGSIVTGQMVLNNRGLIADSIWNGLINDFSDIKLGGHIVMPEHVHGVIRIIKQTDMTLSGIIQAFKSKTAITINKLPDNDIKCMWQKIFWDRVIRDEKEYFFVEEYIRKNPLMTEPENYHKEWFELLEERERHDK
jgi:REP element-mobilizing transposase RayT